jgi:formamidopyrimidine-DNA glycosylase
MQLTLRPGPLRTTYDTMKNVLEHAIASQGDPSRMPKSWLLPRRDPEAKCLRCGSRIQQIKVSGRSAFICPNCQKQKA